MASLLIKVSHRKRFILLFLPLDVSFTDALFCDRDLLTLRGTIWRYPRGWQSWQKEIAWGLWWWCWVPSTHPEAVYLCLWLRSEITYILCCLSYFISEFSVAYNWKYHSSCTQNNILIMFLNLTPVTKYPWNILSSNTWLFWTWEPDVSEKVLYHPLLNHYASYFLSHLSI